MNSETIVENGTLFDAYHAAESGNLLQIATLVPHAYLKNGLWCDGKIYSEKEINQLLLAVSRLTADGFPAYLFFPEDHPERTILQDRLLFYGIRDYGFFIPTPEKPENVFPECAVFPAQALGSLYLKKADVLLKNNNQMIYEYLRANLCAEGER